MIDEVFSASEGHPPSLPALEDSPDLERLARSLELSQRFHLYVLLVPYRLILNNAIHHLTPLVQASRETLVTWRYLRAPLRQSPLAAHSYEDLLENLLRPLLEAPEHFRGRDTIHVIDATSFLPADEPAWRRCMGRLNELRNRLPSQFKGEIIVAFPLEYERAFAESAPDLWAIRSDTFIVDPRSSRSLEPSLRAQVSQDLELHRDRWIRLSSEFGDPWAVPEAAQQELGWFRETSERLFNEGFPELAYLVTRTAQVCFELFPNSDAARGARAHNLSLLSVIESQLDLKDDSILSRKTSIDLFRDLCSRDPSYLGFLAGELRSMGLLLGEGKTSRESVQLLEESISILRKFVEPISDTDRCTLAMSLKTLSDQIRSDHPQRAAELARESCDILKGLVERDRKKYLDLLSSSVNSLGLSVARSGNVLAASEILMEAITLRGELAQSDPENHLPILAMYVGNLTNRFRSMGAFQKGIIFLKNVIDDLAKSKESKPRNQVIFSEFGLARPLVHGGSDTERMSRG